MEIAVQDLNERMRQIIADRERSRARQFSAAQKQVLKSVSSVEKAAVKLGETIERVWGALSRPAEQHGARLSEQILEACRILSDHSPEPSYESLRKFEQESSQTVKAITKAYNRYAPSIIRKARSETSIVRDSIASLDESITDLGRVLDASNLKDLQLIAADAESLVRRAHELSLQLREIHKTKEIAKELEARGIRVGEDLSLLSRDQRLVELSEIERQIKRREDNIIKLLEPLLKPLRKMDRDDNKALREPTKSIITKMLENPLVAVLEFQVSQMQELIFSVSQSLDDGDLFPDQRRRRKAAEAIQALQSGALEGFREDHGLLEANHMEVLRQLRASGVYEQWMSLRSQSDNLGREMAQSQNRIVELQSQEMRLRTSIRAEKEKIESALQKILNGQISILL